MSSEKFLRCHVSDAFTVKGSAEYKKAILIEPFSELLFEKSINGYTTYAMEIYIPQREFKARDVSIDRRFHVSNEMILKFKNGSNSKWMADQLSSAILKKFGARDRSDRTIVPIPASSDSSNEARFRVFIERISSSIQANNGFDYIKIKEDRSPLKGIHKTVNKISNLVFDQDKINNKTIVLIDDVCTSGNSFTQVSEELGKLGAKSVIGIFLAYTKGS
jgi:ATP-dependent DNA helicase RecQ